MTAIILCFFLSCSLGAQEFKNEALQASALSDIEEVKTYYREQEHEKAYKLFLETLQHAKNSLIPDFSSAEEALYEQAFNLYSSKGWQHSNSIDSQILSDFGPIVRKYPQYCRVGYIVAAAYANQGDFPNFFDLFYACHQQCPDHYMAYKSKAILYIKLFEHSVPGNEKEDYRTALLEQLTQAAQCYPADTSLYKLQIIYASEAVKHQIIRDSVKAIMLHNAIVTRSELPFFLEQILSLEDAELMQDFLFKAKEWYQFSRIINEAESILRPKL